MHCDLLPGQRYGGTKLQVKWGMLAPVQGLARARGAGRRGLYRAYLVFVAAPPYITKGLPYIECGSRPWHTWHTGKAWNTFRPLHKGWRISTVAPFRDAQGALWATGRAPEPSLVRPGSRTRRQLQVLHRHAAIPEQLVRWPRRRLVALECRYAAGTTVVPVATAPRLSPSSHFGELVAGWWLFQLGATDGWMAGWFPI